MKAKIKAEHLFNQMNLSSLKMSKKNAKICAIIAVNQIISANPHSNPFNTEVQSTMDYWQEVKSELEKM